MAIVTRLSQPSKRYNSLAGTAGVSQQQIDDRNATTESAKAQLEAAQQDVENYAAKIAFKAIKAPFAGTVTARRVNVGDFIGASGANARSAASRDRCSLSMTYMMSGYSYRFHRHSVMC